MNIQPIQNSVPCRGKWDSWSSIKSEIVQKILDVTPEYTAKDSAKLTYKRNKIDTIVSRPDVNRGIMGVATVLIQPVIDGHNPNVDDKTNNIARNKRIAQSIVTPIAGILAARGPVYKLVTSMTDIKGISKYSRFLLPKSKMQEYIEKPESLKRYRNAISTVLALGVMLFTNFLIDAPLTIFFTNLMNEKSKAKEMKKNE